MKSRSRSLSSCVCGDGAKSMRRRTLASRLMAGDGTDAARAINSANVTSWLRDHVPELAEPLAFELVAAGRSNLTFKVSDADGRAWVLRRPPVGSLLPTAHDMGREYRII